MLSLPVVGDRLVLVMVFVELGLAALTDDTSSDDTESLSCVAASGAAGDVTFISGLGGRDFTADGRTCLPNPAGSARFFLPPPRGLASRRLPLPTATAALRPPPLAAPADLLMAAASRCGRPQPPLAAPASPPPSDGEGESDGGGRASRRPHLRCALPSNRIGFLRTGEIRHFQQPALGFPTQGYATTSTTNLWPSLCGISPPLW
ncbi:hypothetical protein LSTR_LSTR005712 [Laodelphax striatellus]|uniref:Secreted protein n=1 Tax=Laodelphax striatellus TaxID=195883 RepID=A0A482XNH0_LAOST|nr:hypothetical protein LSTR_LSTR005712 [Laodelphax striatellus]